MSALDKQKQYAIDWIEENARRFSDFHLEIWHYAEPAWREYKSAKAYCDLLREEGFAVEEGSGEMPTAFAATWGKGGPVLGSYAEYDAVPGNSQQVVPYQAPREGLHPWAAGHTDPHSVLGTTALAGILATKAAMREVWHHRHAQVLRRAGGKGVRLEAGARGEGLFRRLRRFHLLSPAFFEHDRMGDAVRLVLERRLHLRGAGAREVDRQEPHAHEAHLSRGGAVPRRDRRAVPDVHDDQVHEGGDVPAHRHLDAERVRHGRRATRPRTTCRPASARSNMRGARRRSLSSSRSTTCSPTTRGTPRARPAAKSRCAGSPRRAWALPTMQWRI